MCGAHHEMLLQTHQSEDVELGRQRQSKLEYAPAMWVSEAERAGQKQASPVSQHLDQHGQGCDSGALSG